MEGVFTMKLKIGKVEISIKITDGDSSDLPSEVVEALEILKNYGYKPPASEKQIKSARNAAKVREKRAKEKIEQAVNILVRTEKKAPSLYAIAKLAHVSYNTVRKYRDFINEKISEKFQEMERFEKMIARYKESEN
jgi:predicted Zn-dependent protease